MLIYFNHWQSLHCEESDIKAAVFMPVYHIQKSMKASEERFYSKNAGIQAAAVLLKYVNKPFGSVLV